MKPFRILSLIVAFVFLGIPVSLKANTAPQLKTSPKIITLKDGSRLSGRILTVENDIYSIQTNTLGTLKIDGSQILSIVSPESNILSSGQKPVPAPNSLADDNNTFKTQVQQLQGQVLTNPALMADIQGLMQDEEIMHILSDPELLGVVTSYDPQKIQSSEKMQQLMQNPKMKALIDKLQQQTPTQ